MALKIMYPPQKDSPTTFLLGDISATDTLMTVASAATLPQVLPYPLTLGIDKTLTETVMVTAQNLENNQLTIIRGTPAYTWPAGSKAARVLTAEDFKDLQDNITDINTGLTEAQGSVVTYGTDISALKTTVGDSSSGLVKGLVDEITRATAAEGTEITRATAVEDNLNTIKINRSELAQVITDWVYSADGTKVEVTITRYNASTQQTTQYTRNLPVATDEVMGVMTPEAYAEITALRTDVNSLINLGGRFIGVSFATKAALTAYVVPASVKTGDFTYVIDDETHSGATTRYVRNGSVWDFTFIIDYDPIGIANSTTSGIVKSDSGSTDGKVFVEVDGTMSVIGWGDIVTDISTLNQNKSDKKVPAAVGNIATLDASGNLADGGKTVGQIEAATMKTYKSFAELGFTIDTATVEGLIEAMDDKSTLVVSMDSNPLSSFPASYGVLQIIRVSMYRVSCQFDFTDTSATSKTWFGVYRESATPKFSGWKVLYSEANKPSLADLGLTPTTTELNYVDGVTSAIQTQLDGKEKDHTVVTAMLSTTWTGSAAPYTQAVSVAGVTSSNTIHVALASSATAAQRAAAREAQLWCTSQGTNTITITADGTKPTITLPITVEIGG